MKKEHVAKKMSKGCVNCRGPIYKGKYCEDCYIPKNARGPMKEAYIVNDKHPNYNEGEKMMSKKVGAGSNNRQ